MCNITNYEFLICAQRVDPNIVPTALADVLRGRLNLRTLPGAKLLKSVLAEPVDFSAVNFRIVVYTYGGGRHVQRIKVTAARSGVDIIFNTNAPATFSSFNNERVRELAVLCNLPFFGERELCFQKHTSINPLTRYREGDTLTISFGAKPVLILR